MRNTCAFVLFFVSALLLGFMLVDMKALFSSALSFKLHHEGAAPLTVVLIWPILGLAAFIRGVDCLGRAEVLPLKTRGADLALVALVPVLLGCSFLFQNEGFFSIYDPKGFPVHPPEMIAHPRGRWVTPAAHAFASLVLMIFMGLTWWALGKARGSESSDDRD